MPQKNSTFQQIRPFIKARNVFILLIYLVLGHNLVQLHQELTKTYRLRQKIPYIFLGIKFSGINHILKDNQYAGYLTDKDLDENQPAMQFSQAQYTLAPVLLDLNNPEHEFVLLDFSSPEAAQSKLKELKLQPLSINAFGIILARNPRRTPIEKLLDPENPGQVTKHYDLGERMKALLILLPYLISALTGYLLLQLFGKKETTDLPFLPIFWAIGLGLGVSSLICFSSFLLLGEYQRGYIIGLHLLITGSLLVRETIRCRRGTSRALSFRDWPWRQALPFIIVLATFMTLWIQARFYPLGGWDAWAVWNFKAKFLLKAGSHWQNIFNPMVWRSSPHYPLLLPLINLWGWSFIGQPVAEVPMLTSLVFTFLCSGLMYFGLYRHIKTPAAVLAPLLLLTIPFFGKLATSQYCDIVLGFYLLAAIQCFLLALNSGKHDLSILAGIFLGFLSFSKPEGLLAAILAAALIGGCYLMWDRFEGWGPRKSSLKYFLAFFLITLIPTIMILAVFSPGNQTFVNGLFSEDKPSGLYRLQVTLMFFLVELKGSKWCWVWLLSLAGLVLSWGKCFRQQIRVIPLFLAFYLTGIFAFYLLNTSFEIVWWLQVSLHRIMFSLLPLTLYWVFLSLWPEDQT